MKSLSTGRCYTAAMDAGREVSRRVERLGRRSDAPDHYPRVYLTPAHRAAARQLAAWMRRAGMTVRTDAIGSVIGRYPGVSPRAKTLLFGAHFDSLRNGGKYDGGLGILLPIPCLAEPAPRTARLPGAIRIRPF